MSMVFRLAALWATGAALLHQSGVTISVSIPHVAQNAFLQRVFIVLVFSRHN